MTWLQHLCSSSSKSFSISLLTPCSRPRPCSAPQPPSPSFRAVTAELLLTPQPSRVLATQVEPSSAPTHAVAYPPADGIRAERSHPWFSISLVQSPSINLSSQSKIPICLNELFVLIECVQLFTSYPQSTGQ